MEFGLGETVEQFVHHILYSVCPMWETAVLRTGSCEQGLGEEELLIPTLEKPSLVESPCANA